MLILFIDGGYEIIADSYCAPYRTESFPTLSEAKIQCSDDPSCSMFYHYAGANTYYVCEQGSEIIPTSAIKSGILLAIKRSEYACIFTSFGHDTNHNMVMRLC